MSGFRLTPLAIADLDEIAIYLAGQSGPALALQVQFDLVAKFRLLAAFPGLGHSRTDLTRRPVVFFPSLPYLIIYDRTESPIVIHAVLHSARDIKQILRRRPKQ